MKKIIFLVVYWLIIKFGYSQSSPLVSDFTIQSAIDYALKHNSTYLNSELDVKLAEYKNKEFIGIGFPQLNGSAELKDFFEIPTSLIPGQFFGGAPGTFIPVKFGTQYNAQAGGSVSQLIFSSDYFVGLKAAKELKLLAQKNSDRTKTETIVNISKAYYNALISKERLKTLNANVIRIKKIYDDTKALNANGFVEKIDVDRLEITYNNLVTEKEKIERLVGVSETLLKFQMGFDLKQPIKLTDEIKADQLQDLDLLLETKINYEARNEYSLLQSQEKLNNIELKRYKLSYLPTLAGFASYNVQAQRTKFDFTDPNQLWFPIGVLGATLNLPIFSGGQKYYRVKQSQINLLKTKNNLVNLKLAIDLEVQMGSISYKNAFASMLAQKRNRELAVEIFEVSKKKYEAGVGSNLEIITAETGLKEAETNYLNAVYDLLIAKIELDKALGNIK